jgi:hypothetical protein
MALWGRDDNLTSAGTVWLNYSTGIVTATGTDFADADVGKVLRFGVRGGDGVYFGDGVISKRTSTTQVTIASTEGLSGVAIAGTDYYLSELPSYTVGDSSYSEKNSGYDRIIYGISTNTSLTYDGVTTEYRTGGSGWVGVTTYVDCDGNFRVKSEVLVAMGGNAGITTGSNGIAYPTAE